MNDTLRILTNPCSLAFSIKSNRKGNKRVASKLEAKCIYSGKHKEKYLESLKFNHLEFQYENLFIMPTNVNKVNMNHNIYELQID